MDRLNGDIAAASKEQDQGIQQVNVALSQMDRVTQTTAANAEESASASTELTSQAANLKSVVVSLVRLSTGREQADSAREVSSTKDDAPESSASQTKSSGNGVAEGLPVTRRATQIKPMTASQKRQAKASEQPVEGSFTDF